MDEKIGTEGPLVGNVLTSLATTDSLGLVTLAKSTSSSNGDLWFQAITDELGGYESTHSISFRREDYTFQATSYNASMVLAQTPKINRNNAIFIQRLTQTSQLTIFFASADFNFDDTGTWFPIILGSQIATNQIQPKFPRRLLVCLESSRVDGQVFEEPGLAFTIEDLKRRLLPFAQPDLPIDVLVLPKIARLECARNHLKGRWEQEFAHLFMNFVPHPVAKFIDFANSLVQQVPMYTLPSYTELFRVAQSSKVGSLASGFERELDLFVKPFIDCDPPTFEKFVDWAVSRLLEYPYGKKVEVLPPNDQRVFMSRVENKRTALWVMCAQNYEEEEMVLEDAYLRSVLFLLEHVRTGECKSNSHRMCCLSEFDKLIGQEGIRNLDAKIAFRQELDTFVQHHSISNLTQKTLDQVEKAQLLTGLLKEFNAYLNARVSGDKNVLVDLCVASIRDGGCQANQPEDEIESTVSAFRNAVKHSVMPSPEPEHYHPPQQRRKQKSWKKWVAMAVSVALSVYMPMALGPLLAAKIGALGSAVVTGALTGAAKNVATTTIMGGKIQAKAVFRSAFTSAVSAGGAHIVGSAFGNQWSFAKSISHGVAGGVASVTGGGKFGHGFVSAVVSDAVLAGIEQLGDSAASSQRQIGCVEKVFAGGSASAIAHLVLGGDEPLLAFAQGASTAYFNHVMHELDEVELTQKQEDEFYQALEEDYAQQLVKNPNLDPEEYLKAFGIGIKDMETNDSSSSMLADVANEAVYFVPVIGEIRSMWDAIQYLKAGELGNAAWSLFGAIPFAGRIQRLSVATKVLSKEGGARSMKAVLNEGSKAKVASSSSASSKSHSSGSKPKERPCNLNKEYSSQSALRQAFMKRVEYEFSNPQFQPTLTRTMSKRSIRACVDAVRRSKAAGKSHVAGLKVGGVPHDICHNQARQYGGKNSFNNVHLYNASFNRSEGSRIASQGAKLDAARSTPKPK